MTSLAKKMFLFVITVAFAFILMLLYIMDCFLRRSAIHVPISHQVTDAVWANFLKYMYAHANKVCEKEYPVILNAKTGVLYVGVVPASATCHV